ncbi:uncharacterized protein LOC130679200 [Manis pentadactyla]|uniref:uncharacterized protein LOC130679200 n=1 Tax=Manis pentadactyla TaxID=143292 RepID=UPI00255D068C|nr:uncharacterized protein LOC130679200 [Manis pentadactyla]
MKASGVQWKQSFRVPSADCFCLWPNPPSFLSVPGGVLWEQRGHQLAGNSFPLEKHSRWKFLSRGMGSGFPLPSSLLKASWCSGSTGDTRRRFSLILRPHSMSGTQASSSPWAASSDSSWRAADLARFPRRPESAGIGLLCAWAAGQRNQATASSCCLWDSSLGPRVPSHSTPTTPKRQAAPSVSAVADRGRLPSHLSILLLYWQPFLSDPGGVLWEQRGHQLAGNSFPLEKHSRWKFLSRGMGSGFPLPSSLLKASWCSGSTGDTRRCFSLILRPHSLSTTQASALPGAASSSDSSWRAADLSRFPRRPQPSGRGLLCAWAAGQRNQATASSCCLWDSSLGVPDSPPTPLQVPPKDKLPPVPLLSQTVALSPRLHPRPPVPGLLSLSFLRTRPPWVGLPAVGTPSSSPSSLRCLTWRP